ncbi:mediator of RNA polymerase II transcription subunit 26 isoform X2 [Eurosta solidaginis]|uniref:mediator of RNA polymerase II transcription subunit 26 isoform X2 n=1 Tax=Eurosta solidaginis TaxID=178769 RepID=UPI0035313D27
MNTQHIYDLTLRLCKSLDQNYDVVNMDSVVSVISSLECSPVTREQLEATRLAKFINHLRRRTKDENLARRAKSLLKKWREMVGIQQQQVLDTSHIKSSTGLTSVAGYNTKIYGQYHTLRPRSSLPVEPLTNFDAIHQTPNLYCHRKSNVTEKTSAINSGISTLTNITSDHIIFTENAKVHPSGDASFGSSAAEIVSSSNGIQPTSFKNVFSCVGVADNINVGMIADGSTNKQNKPMQQHVLPFNSDTFIIDHSSHSNSEKSQSSYIAPVVINIQDSNSCSNLDTNVPIEMTTSNKVPSTETKTLNTTCLVSGVDNNISTSCYKSKKVKKERKRREKNDYSNHNIVGGMKVASILLNDTLSNRVCPPQSSESTDKFEAFVYREQSQSTYTEMPSLLNSSSMSSILFAEESTNTTEKISSPTSHQPLTTDLTFTGKIKKSTSGIPTHSNNLVCYNTQVDERQDVCKSHLLNSDAGNTEIYSELVLESVATSNSPNIATQELPKRRGRKKGSKGVDSIIAKEGCRTSQSLITPLGSANKKKVKTTKELYAEMQNRKLCSKAAIPLVSTSWAALQHQELSPPSSCSDCKEEEGSSSETITSEPSRDSSNDPSYPKHHALSIESSSNSQLNTSKDITDISQPLVTVETSETVNDKYTNWQELHEIIKKLPPLQSISVIESRYQAELIPCTCKISEVMPNNKAAYRSTQTENGTVEKVVSDQSIRQSVYTEQPEDVSCRKLNIGSENSCNFGRVEQRSPLLALTKPKKSIFDFDFDDDEDPLYSLKAESTADAIIKKQNKGTNIKTEIISELDVNELSLYPTERSELVDYKITEEPLAEESMTQELVSPLYIIEEDSLCIAKQRFDQQSQAITKFHLDVLHRYVVPNVNGNWDVRSQDEIQTERDVDISYKVTNNIVPKYSFLTMESIQTKLRQISILTTLSPNEGEAAIKHFSVIPFLGVTHSSLINSIEEMSSNTKALHAKELSVFDSKPVETNQNVSQDELNFNSDSRIPDYITKITSNDSSYKTSGLLHSHDVARCSILNKKMNKAVDNLKFEKAGNCTDLSRNFSNNFNGCTQKSTKFNTDVVQHNQFYGRRYSKKPLFGSEIYNDTNCKSLNKPLGKELTVDVTKIWHDSNMPLSPNQEQPHIIKLKRKLHNNNIDVNVEKKPSFKKSSRCNEITCDDSIEPDVKRNKIIMNGSNRECSGGIIKQLTDTCIDNDINVHDVVVMNEVNDCIELQNNLDNTTLQKKQCDDEKFDTDMSVNNLFDEKRREYDFTGSVKLNEYLDNEDFYDRYHEGVVRDTSLSSEEGSHIVLTIKQPKQPHLPPLSHNVASSIIFSNNIMDCQSEINASATACTIQTSNVPGYTYQQPTLQSAIKLTPIIKKMISFECSKDTQTPSQASLKGDLTSGILRSKLDDVIEGRVTNIYEEYAISNGESESTKPETAAKCSGDMKEHRKLFLPREIFYKDYDGNKRSILNISSCSSSCTEYSEKEYSNDSFTTVAPCEPKKKIRGRFEFHVDESSQTSRSRNLMQLSLPCTAHSSTNNKSSTKTLYNSEGRNRLINECSEKQYPNYKTALLISNADSNVKDAHLFAGTTDINMNCDANEEFSLQSNCLLQTPNDIYLTVGELETSKIFISQGNAANFEKEVCDNVTCPSFHEYNHQEQNFPNSTCDESIFYNKQNYNSLITYNKESSLFKNNDSNKHKFKSSENIQHQQKDDTVVNLSADDKSINVYRTKTNHMLGYGCCHNGNFCNAKISTESKICTSPKGQSRQDNIENCTPFKVFREWHQVLQLHSYNDELLTVLPYVVFD